MTIVRDENGTNGRIPRCVCRCKQLIKNNKFVLLCISCIAIAVVILFVVPTLIPWGRKDRSDPESGYTSGYSHEHRGKVTAVLNDENALFINQDACDECIMCKANVTLDYIPYDELKCETSDRNIKNASCYFCNNTCLTADDISRIAEKEKMIKCENNAPVEIDCCLVAKMANLENRLTEGRYECYVQSVHELYNNSGVQPLWHCQSGRKGERCQYRNAETFICKCFKYNYRFYNQHMLPQCNNETRALRSSECYMYRDIYGGQHNCYCSKTPDNENDNVDSCESLAAD
ncbi:uncharacterized protein LOC123525223 isoform X2 [Mercenaria mercenaria]|uniref:uncharacterized protein LOC123525223 isoform X2 n=1 Tax=Mercenaria mercenaria TaxID=6596 RepID=UPI00234F310E|nr:uncharacterized protein LOC123525223 isoform X2 [Mercenaria mercenaria]